jgi:GT2 family glycosyltransferase
VSTTTVLVLSVDEAPLLERSLPAIVGQGAEVMVVDNACTDSTVEVAERAGARTLRLAHRLSYAAALNAAIAATGGDAVLLLNADCVAAPGFVAALEARLASDERLGSVAPKLLRATGLDEADRLEEIDAAGIVVTRWGKNLLVGHGAPAAAYAQPADVFAADGAAALWRRHALEDVAVGSEVLDEDMALWATESDLGWRAQLRGWRCGYEPAAVAWHVRSYRPSTPRGALPAEHRRLQFRNRLLMVAKNATPTAGLLPVLGYEVAAFGHALLRERVLLGGYRDAWRLREGVRRRRGVIQRRRTLRRPPFGLRPPA